MSQKIRNGDRLTEMVADVLGQPSVAYQLSATTSGANQALSTPCNRISIRCRTADCRLTIGASNQASAVNATSSHFILAGERLDFSVPAASHLGYIRDSAATANGTLEVTELI